MSDQRDRLPPYRKIAEDLRAEIKAGRYLPGQQVPSVTKLCETYSVTRNTAIRALRVLKDDGLIVIEQGWGSFVADPLPPPTD
jgi:DNA-binding GntR family transcriptional regulator